MYELSYVWKDCPESDVENYILMGIFTQKNMLRKAIKKIRKKESKDKKRGKIYINKIDLNRKINGWENGYFTDFETGLDLPFWMKE